MGAKLLRPKDRETRHLCLRFPVNLLKPAAFRGGWRQQRAVYFPPEAVRAGSAAPGPPEGGPSAAVPQGPGQAPSPRCGLAGPALSRDRPLAPLSVPTHPEGSPEPGGKVLPQVVAWKRGERGPKPPTLRPGRSRHTGPASGRRRAHAPHTPRGGRQRRGLARARSAAGHPTWPP